MSDPFAHRQEFARFMHDLDPTVGGSGFTADVPTANFQGIFLDGDADIEDLSSSGDPDEPTWMILWDLLEPDVNASYADGGRGQWYDIAFDFIGERKRVEPLLVQVGPQITSYLDGLTEANWTFLTNNPRPGLGAELIGDLEGRGFFHRANAC